MNTYEGEKYYCFNNDIKSTIDKYGVAIIPNLLTDIECNNLIDGMFNFLEYITKDTPYQILRDDSSTWKNYSNLYPTQAMILQHWSIGHAQHIWDLRQNDKILDIFAKFYEVDKKDLLVSFDGSGISFPPEITNRGWNTKKINYHCDQSYMRNDFECIQSWVNAYDTNPGDATLAFLEGSNHFHKQFNERFKINNKSDWHQLNSIEKDYYISLGCTEKKITCPKGSLVLWDSRTIHTGLRPYKTRPNPNFRCVVYLCYQPRSMITPNQLKKKIKAFQDLRTTSHYPCKVKLFSKVPRTYGGILPNFRQIEPPLLNDIGRKLIGYNNG